MAFGARINFHPCAFRHVIAAAMLCRTQLFPGCTMSTATTHGAAIEPDGLPAPQRRLVIAAVLTSIVLVVLDGAIANLALPTIALSLEVPPAAAVWVVTGYQLALVMFLLPAGAAGESL